MDKIYSLIKLQEDILKQAIETKPRISIKEFELDFNATKIIIYWSNN